MIDIATRLVVATFLGGLIGLEREYNGRPAGFRTHLLVCLGSALIMLISDQAAPGGDPTRIAAQVVSGIGFLGAGTIIQSQGTITGLTTATTLWVSAAIGLACGIAYYEAAVLTVVLTLFVLIVFRKINAQISDSFDQILTVEFDHEELLNIFSYIKGPFEISKEEYDVTKGNAILELRLHLKRKEKEKLLKKLYENKKVLRVEYQTTV